jgi:hypothetical protein
MNEFFPVAELSGKAIIVIEDIVEKRILYYGRT